MPERPAFIEHAGRNLVALRTRRYKYIRHLRTINLQPGYPFIAGKEELYDLLDDRAEEHNLVAQNTAVLAELRAFLAEQQKSPLNMVGGTADVSSDTLEVLRSLGYVR